jgi:hypothetical protein
MESILLCVGAFAAVYWCTKGSLVYGLRAVILVGYFYGIVRANVPQTGSHFIFDAGIGGLYLGTLLRGLTPIQKLRIRKVRGWVVCLVAWPLLLFFVPAQDSMIQLVGLRSAVWFVPFLIFGALIDDKERSQLAVWLAILNLAALGFGLAEFTLGIPRFYPHNVVTELIYKQNDVVQGDYSVFRIPAIFVNQAGYSATMVLSMPFLAGAGVQTECTRQQKLLLSSGIIAAMLGVFLGASRSQALLLFGQTATLIGFAKIRPKHLLAFAAVATVVGYNVYSQPRLQRFTRLDFDYVDARVHGSVNEGFLEAVIDHPLGNGLGGGGTSIPYFLEGRLKNPVAIENEYGHILLELGIPGLLLWAAFIVMVIAGAPSERAGPWRVGWRLSRVTVALYFGTAFIGIGLMTAVPGTCMLLLMTGWMCAPKLKRFRITADEAEPWAYQTTD